MGLGIFQKIIKNHLIEGKMALGKTLGIKIDQTLTHDATGTMVYLEFETLGIPKVKTEISVSYVDHNLLQNGFMNADDHIFLQTSSSKYGVYFSRPGNGICHQLHLERFAIPGKTLLGSDSHTPTCGGIGMVSIGVGGLDVALAMAGKPFYIKMPQIVNVKIKGKLKPFVSAKDIILFLLKQLTVKGGVNKVFEFSGPGVSTLDVPERATIANMGAELGSTTTIFPSDDITYKFMKLQNRERDWVKIEADKDAVYDQTIEINLDSLDPLIAQPNSPDNVVKIKNIAGTKVDQVAIGSCTNSSFKDLMKVALILKDKKIHPDAINPGSRQVLKELEKRGAISWLLSAGVRILEIGCGPCIGMGFSPSTNGVSLRTYNRNFLGRSGTKSAKVYLVSPESAAAAAITGVITDPRNLGLEPLKIEIEKKIDTNDSMILSPSVEPEKVKIIKGPNIYSLPLKDHLENKIEAKIELKVGDNITTDDIIPAGANVLPLRSNLPKISEHTFESIDPKFVSRMKKEGKGIIIGGVNYGQGSSREHAALTIMYLGIKMVVVKSFARIHRSNLINCGILLRVGNLESDIIEIKNVEKNFMFKVKHDLNNREKDIVKAGGILPYYKNK